MLGFPQHRRLHNRQHPRLMRGAIRADIFHALDEFCPRREIGFDEQADQDAEHARYRVELVFVALADGRNLSQNFIEFVHGSGSFDWCGSRFVARVVTVVCRRAFVQFSAFLRAV